MTVIKGFCQRARSEELDVQIGSVGASGSLEADVLNHEWEQKLVL